MTHICFVINDYSFLLTHRLDLLGNLANSFKVSVICNIKNIDKDKVILAKNANINIIQIKKRDGLFDSFRYKKDLLRKLNCQFSHIFFITLEQSFFGALLAKKMLKQKKYFVLSGLGHNFFKKNLKNRSIKILQRLFFKLAFKRNLVSGVIFQNADDSYEFKNFQKIFLTPEYIIKGNGINVDNFPYMERNFQEFHFCYTGRLVKSKGINKLIEAYDYLSKKYLNMKFHLSICGIYDESDRDSIDINTLKKLENSSSISLYRNVMHTEVLQILKQANIFILPSIREGISKSALEAASTGMPILAADNPCTCEVVKNRINGLIYSDKNNLGLNLALEEIISLSEDELIKFGKSSRKFIESTFSLNQITSEYLDIIRQ